VRSTSVDELSQRLDQRFALLTDGSRAALPRHRTLRSMLDWSYDLLAEREQAMLRRVAVFAAGWTLASAEQVCAGDGVDASGIIEQLTSLVDKSLVVTDELAGATRYRMLETVRQYALDRLRESSEEARWRGRHLAHFLALGEEFYAELSTPKQRSLLSRLAAEHDNVRAALGWSVESSPMEGLRLATAFNMFWRIRGHLAEGRDWLVRLLAAVPSEPRTRERAGGQGATAALALAQGDHVAAKRLFQESLAFYREIDDQSRVAWVLGGLGILSLGQGHYAEAEAFLRESVDRARATASRRTLFASLGNLGLVMQTQDQRAAARKLQEEALEVARELDAPWEIGWGLNEIGWAEYNEERWDLAQKRFAEGITLLHGVGDRPGVIVALEGLAALAGAMAPERAARLWGAADGLREQIGNARTVPDNVVYELHTSQVRAALTAEASNQAWSEGRAMSLDDAVRYALEQAGRDN
jgi:non-specific serine/threonine protein kinase